MEELLEYTVVTYLKDDKLKEEQEKYRDMGIPMDSEDEVREERLLKYAFNPSDITEVRQTFVTYKGKWEDAVVVTITDKLYETPPLLVSYDEFKKDLKEWNETYKKTNEA